MSGESRFRNFEKIFYSKYEELAFSRVKDIIKLGVDINALSPSIGCTALMLAVAFQHDSRNDIIQYLIDNGAVINARSSKTNRGGTALHIAAYMGHFDAAKLLLNNQADPTVLDDELCSAAQIATYNYELETDPVKRVLYFRCKELLNKHEREAKRKQEDANITPERKRQIINSVMRRNRAVSLTDRADLKHGIYPSPRSFSPMLGIPMYRPKYSTGNEVTKKLFSPLSTRHSNNEEHFSLQNENDVSSISGNYTSNYTKVTQPASYPVISVNQNHVGRRYSECVSRSPMKQISTQTACEVQTQTLLPEAMQKVKLKKFVKTTASIVLEKADEEIFKPESPCNNLNSKKIYRAGGIRESKKKTWNYFENTIVLSSSTDSESVKTDENEKNSSMESNLSNEANVAFCQTDDESGVSDSSQSFTEDQIKANSTKNKMVSYYIDEILKQSTLGISCDYSQRTVPSITDSRPELGTPIIPVCELNPLTNDVPSKSYQTEGPPTTDITPFPSSIINMVSSQPPTGPDMAKIFSSIKEEGSEKPDNSFVHDQKLAESFRLSFSFDESAEIRSSVNNSINKTSPHTSLTENDYEDIEHRVDALDIIQLRKELMKYQVKMPFLNNENLIIHHRTKLKNLMKLSSYGAIYSNELLMSFKIYPDVSQYNDLQLKLQYHDTPSPKKYFNYVLLDPRKLNNLQKRATTNGKAMREIDVIKCFTESIFYVGKGSGVRPNDHIKSIFTKGQNSEKLRRIEEILSSIQESSGDYYGLVIQQFSHGLTNKQALMQEAAIIRAICIENLTNVKLERFRCEDWNDEDIRRLGSCCIFTACRTYLLQPESFIYPRNA